MRIARAMIGLIGGLAVAGAGTVLLDSPDAEARTKRRGRQRGPLRLIDVSVADEGNVPGNAIIEMRFTRQIARSSVNPAVFQIRAQNADNTGFAKQVAGDFQWLGNLVRFYPRLPTHLRDPDSDDGGFYPVTHSRDDAEANAGLQPDTAIEIAILGNPNVAAVRAPRGRKLNKTYRQTFRTAPEGDPTLQYTRETYQDNPPPGFVFSNPSDKVASVADQYALHGGTIGVPSNQRVTLFGRKVPISPPTLRQPGNVTLTLLERKGDTSQTKPIQGNPFVEQNFDGVRMVFEPRFALPDVGVYALRVTKDVKDLTEQLSFRSNQERLRLREIYAFMDAARTLQPGTPLEQLPSPDTNGLAFDWPTNQALHGPLRRNILLLGDAFPAEIDPRVMILFSTRDEPVSEDNITIEFEDSEPYYDPVSSTATWDDDGSPGTVSAIHTVAGGSAVNGDFEPEINETISADGFPGGVINWRKVRIPQGVVVNILGSRPAVIRCLEFELEGELRVDGSSGQNANTGTYQGTNQEPPTSGAHTQRRGGAGGPGGGDGADSGEEYYDNGDPPADAIGGTGDPGVDLDGDVAPPGAGGRGGEGGRTSTGTYYRMGGAGGGGGARTAGTAGAATGPLPNNWGNGFGGAGGAGSDNDALDPLVGGAGGGSGGNATWAPGNWKKTAGAGGGGGGALLLQSSGIVSIGSTGVIRARGGRGGNGTNNNSTLSAGPGGGGGGGSLLLRSSRGFNLANASAAFDVRGGQGGTQSGTYTASPGGNGGVGYLRLEDPNGGLGVSGGTAGTFDPVGGGVPSFALTNFIDIGVDAPRFLNFGPNDIEFNEGANDALFVEIQYAIEDPDNFGQPLLTALDPNGNSTDVSEISQWTPVLVADNVPTPNGAFGGTIPGYDRSLDGTPKFFETADVANAQPYKFVRFRFTFQLDATQTVRDPLPNVSKLVIRFQFNN